MKIAKKIAAALLAAAMAFTALVIPVGADSIEDTATAITSGKSVSTNLYAYGDEKDYKISVNSSGKLTISLESQMKEMGIYLFDVNGNKVAPISTDASSGNAYYESYSKYTSCYWNNTIEKFKGSVSYSVTSGTYYIRFKRYNSSGNGKLTFTATYPSTTAKKAKISYININLAKGSTLSLGATVTNGGTVTWKSSNSSVVTVSSAGSITAKGKGSAIITAKCGSSSKKVKIVVS